MKVQKKEDFLKKLPLPKGWSLPQNKGKRILCRTPRGQDFGLDFSSKKALSRKQPLAKSPWV